MNNCRLVMSVGNGLNRCVQSQQKWTVPCLSPKRATLDRPKYDNKCVIRTYNQQYGSGLLSAFLDTYIRPAIRELRVTNDEIDDCRVGRTWRDVVSRDVGAVAAWTCEGFIDITRRSGDVVEEPVDVESVGTAVKYRPSSTIDDDVVQRCDNKSH